MFGDDHPVLANDDPVSIGLHFDGAADGSRDDGISVVVEAPRAGLRHRGRGRVEAVELSGVADQRTALGLEGLPDRPIRGRG